MMAMGMMACGCCIGERRHRPAEDMSAPCRRITRNRHGARRHASSAQAYFAAALPLGRQREERMAEKVETHSALQRIGVAFFALFPPRSQSFEGERGRRAEKKTQCVYAPCRHKQCSAGESAAFHRSAKAKAPAEIAMARRMAIRAGR